MSYVIIGMTTTPLDTAAAIARNQILIEGDSDFTSANGVVSGSGTPDDPFVISGWEIDPEGGFGISIMDTRAHFVITEVAISSDTSEYQGTGIDLRNVTNGTMLDCSVEDVYFGICMFNSQSLTVRSCSISNIAQEGVCAFSYQGLNRDIAIMDCTVVGCEVFTDEGYSIVNFGFDLRGVYGLRVENNSVTGAMRALESWDCSDVRIANDSFALNRESGTALYGCARVDIADNEYVANGVSGLWVSECLNMTITRNEFAGNNYGIYFEHCSGSLVHHNDLVGNNANAYPYGGVNNSWDSGYPGGGNYWSDYLGVDEYSGVDQTAPGSDGIGDTPYDIDYLSDYEDRYPLMNPVLGPLNEPPVAVMSVEPSEGTTATVFMFDASGSYDAEDPTSELMVRWDVGYEGTWEVDWTTDKTMEWTFPSPGTYAVRLQVRDTDMYLADDDTSVQVYDVVEVSTTAVVSGTEGEDGWFVSEATVELEASGDYEIDHTDYRVDVSDWQIYTGFVLISEDGVHTVEFHSEDILGNVEDVDSVEVRIDCSAPTLEMITEDDSLFNSSDVDISWTCADPCSGIDQVEYSLDGGAFAECEDLSGIGLSDLDNGTHTIVVVAYDEAGNSATQELTFEVEVASDSTDDDPADISDGGTPDWLMIGAIMTVVAAAAVATAVVLRRAQVRRPKS
jgi:parallel beta-helix repeat protein